MMEIIAILGHISTLIVVLGVIFGLVAWFMGILPAMLRLGNGLAKRKIAIFAKGDNVSNLSNLLIDSKLFKSKNIYNIESKEEIGRAEKATIFLVAWHDWKSDINNILDKKQDNTALVIYAPQSGGFIPPDIMKKLDMKRNVIVTNFRGRMINDIIVSMISTR